MTASDQTPTAPHALGSLTTGELARYRRTLEYALHDRTIGSAPVAEVIRQKLQDVLNEEIQREQLQHGCGSAWPVSN